MTSNSNPSKTINYTKIVDLSHVIDSNIPLWSSDPPVEFESVANLEKDGYYLRRFSIGEHSGTHINAPNSFHANGAGIDTYPAASLVVSAVVIDVQRQTAANADYALTKLDVLNWEQQYQRIPVGSVVLLYTGWQAKWQDGRAFFNQDAQGGWHFLVLMVIPPDFSLKNVALLGLVLIPTVSIQDRMKPLLPISKCWKSNASSLRISPISTNYLPSAPH
jgi:kynurenine formamidase